MARYFCTISLIASFIIVVSAQEVSFQASVNPDQISAGSIFNISFTLYNASGEDFKPPDLANFRVISGPSRAFRSTSINGKLTQSTSYSYSLQAVREGEYIIQPASISVGGKALLSNIVKINVSKAGSISDPGVDPGNEEQVFLRMETDSMQVYIGQQMVVNYKIYTTVDIENIEILFESKYLGCFAQNLETYNETTKRELVNGREYRSRIIKKVAVFPQQQGRIVIEPAVIRVGIPDQSSIFRGLFSSFNLKSRNLTGNEIEFFVLDPHDGAPDYFTGAVGDFEIEFSLDPVTITTDDATTLKMRVRGDGDLKMVRPPVWEFGDVWEIYDPKVVHEQTIHAQDSLVEEKTIEYLLIAGEPGQFNLFPQFTFFNPVNDSFLSVTDTFSVFVEAGTRYQMRSDENTRSISDQSIEEIAIIPQTRLSKRKKRWMKDPFSWILLFSPFSLWIVTALIRINKNSGVKETGVFEHTLEQIQQAHDFIEKEEQEKFFSSIATNIKLFVCIRVHHDPSLFQHKEVTVRMKQNGASEDNVRKFSHILNMCYAALYSGNYDQVDMNSILKDAETLVKKLEHELQK